MKLLHTSDWHLGRVTYNQSRAPDHDAVLAEIIELAREQRPDLVVHSGDLFDVPRPAYQDIERGLVALQELAGIAPVVVVAGNHDSPALFRIFQKLLGPASRIRFIDKPRVPEDGGILDYPLANGERIRVAPLPFIHQNRFIEGFSMPETWSGQYADQVQQYESILADGLAQGADYASDILVFAAHLHVGGASYSGSEKPIHIGDAYATRAENLPTVSYAAFGHIHKPQRLPGIVPGRYAGSPLQLDFGEEGEQKQVVMVEAKPGRPPDITDVPLRAGRPLRRVSGTLEELAARAGNIGNALCLVTVRTETTTMDLSRRVAEILPEATILEVYEQSDRPAVTVVTRSAAEAQREPSNSELFAEYLATLSPPGSKHTLSVFETLLEAVGGMEQPTFEAETALAAPIPGQGA